MPVTVSIITVARNAHAFLRDTIESVAVQTYRHIEFIVIDGASTDGTLDVIQTNSARISKWLSEPDAGIADAFNKGLGLATGDYVLFLNSDDRLASPKAVESIVSAISENGRPDLVYGDCDLIDRDSGEHLYRASIAFSASGLKRGQTLPHPSLFMSRGYFERFGKYDIDFRIAMDFEILLRGALQSKILHVPVVTTEVRAGGISTRSEMVVDEIVAALRKNGFIRTPIGAAAMRGYFRARAVLRKIRDSLIPVL